VLWEDEHLLALDKPSRLLTSPDRHDLERVNLMRLLHRDIERGAAWARQRNLAYLANAHRLDFDTTGVLLLAKSKPILVSLTNDFGNGRLEQRYLALAHGAPAQDRFEVNAKLGPHPTRTGLVRVDPWQGKRSLTRCAVLERFRRFTLLECRLGISRTHQVRVHLRYAGVPLVGDALYGGQPLLLSRLKPGYQAKRHAPERPLIGYAALHAAELRLTHPVTGAELVIAAPWPKDLTVAVKYLRRFAPGDNRTGMAKDRQPPPSPSDLPLEKGAS